MQRVGRSIVVTGRVQGVFFRAWTAEQARSLGVVGWVRNRADGSVEAHAAGSPESVERLAELMKRGPPQAEVEDFRSEAVTPENLDSFSIR
jgi:acylphosphatase